MLSPIMLTIGSVPIYWYGFIVTMAFLIGALLVLWLAKEKGLNQDHLLNMFILIIPAAIIGARLFHVAFSWDYYGQHLIEIFALRQGGLAVHGGIIGGVLAGFLYVRKHKLDFWQLADIFAPAVVLGQAIGRWGNFFNQEAYGGPVTLAFISRFPDFIQQQMLINGQYHHPAFLYESVCCLLAFVILMWKSRHKSFPGEIALWYLILYSTARFFIEILRTDSLMLGSFKSAQVISLLLIVLAIQQLYTRYRRYSAKDQ
jgi:phosphatidylglycerol:prolipoprotein diacylglycerol transferase